MSDYSLGMMQSGKDALEQLKKEIYRDDKPYRTVQTRIEELTPEERKKLVQVAQIVLAFQRENVRGTGVTDIDYMGLIERLYRGLKPDLKVLLNDVLTAIEPVKVVKKPKPDYRDALLKMYDQDERFKTPLPKYELPIQEPFKDTPEPKAKPSPTLPPKQTQQPSFLSRLEDSESSGRSDAEIKLDDGRKFVGKLQFGEARLKDYQKATGTKFTQQEFKDNLALQDRVAAWHLEDLAKAVDELGDAAKGYSKEGLLAVGHLGGKSGMEQFVKSKGQYDPEDALGTSLSDYYNKFSGAA